MVFQVEHTESLVLRVYRSCFFGARYLTRSLPKGSAATDAKAGWCSVLQLLRLEVRYHRYSGFSGGVDHSPATQAGLVRESSN